MTPLIIGKTGQLAAALADLRPDGVYLDRAALDLSKDSAAIVDALNETAQQHALGGVILAAAYTAVDRAEDDVSTATAVNGRAPAVIARWCRAQGVPLVHISTDYVFNGTAKAPYCVDDPTDPVNAYGQSKRDGEIAVLNSGAVAAVLRTSWVYDTFHPNFLTTMLRLAETRDSLRVVDDQIGRPTYAPDLARAVLRTLEILRVDPSKAGLYHVTNTGDPISWAGFASAIFAADKLQIAVESIPSSDYPTPARRPLYSVMDVGAFERAFDQMLPDWRDGLRRAMSGRKSVDGRIS